MFCYKCGKKLLTTTYIERPLCVDCVIEASNSCVVRTVKVKEQPYFEGDDYLDIYTITGVVTYYENGAYFIYGIDYKTKEPVKLATFIKKEDALCIQREIFNLFKCQDIKNYIYSIPLDITDEELYYMLGGK